MKQATKRIMELLLIISFAAVLYYPSMKANDNNFTPTENLSAEAGVVYAINEMAFGSSYSATAGSVDAVTKMMQKSQEVIEMNAINPVGIPLEEATMNENGEVEEAEFTPYVMYVTPSFLNVRSMPSTEEENVIGKLNINDEVLVIGECEDNWVMISYNDEIAYISSEFIQETLPEADTYNNEWTGEKLNRHDGKVTGPSGKETYYNLNMSKCIYYMQQLGYYEHYWVRSDGVKMYGNFVMCACNLKKHPKGSLVETTLGTGIVVDTGAFATNGSDVEVDIATTWKGKKK